MKSKKLIIVLIIIIILLLIFGTAEVLRTYRTDNEFLIKDDNATPWKGEQSLPKAARAQGAEFCGFNVSSLMVLN